MVLNSYKYGYQVLWKCKRLMTTINNKLANLKKKKIATLVNTNRAEKHGLLLKMGNDRIRNLD